MIKILLICLALSIGQYNSVSFPLQAHSTIDGRVTTPEGKGIAMLQVSLQNDGYAYSGMVYTDGSGHFRFANLRSGTYYVVVEPGSTFSVEILLPAHFISEVDHNDRNVREELDLLRDVAHKVRA